MLYKKSRVYNRNIKISDYLLYLFIIKNNYNIIIIKKFI